jgi:hypothetical protein
LLLRAGIEMVLSHGNARVIQHWILTWVPDTDLGHVLDSRKNSVGGMSVIYALVLIFSPIEHIVNMDSGEDHAALVSASVRR